MNQIDSVVSNRSTGACQAASEVAKGCRKAVCATASDACAPRRTRLASACLLALGTLAGASAWTQDSAGTITGAAGTDGVASVTTGTDGGAGSAAVQSTGSGTHSGTLTGGSGGTGGAGLAGGGSGGAGGTGLASNGPNAGLYNTGSISGGRGGDGGSGPVPGPGGTGGTGVLLAAPGTLINEGSIAGGRGGLGGAAGGVGVAATGGASFENGGTVRGGLSGDGLSLADAIRFTGDNNFLGLVSTSVIEGNVVGSPSGDTLGLSGSTDASFNTALIGPSGQYRGFAGFQKLESGTWTLTGTTTALTPWQVLSGTLVISSDASLGDAAGRLTLDGGTLRSTADVTASRAILLGAANGALALDAGTTYTANGVVSGSGGLTKAGGGTAVLAGANTYSGGTFVQAGTLAGSAASFGSGAIANNAGLVIDQAGDGTLNNAISGTGRITKTGAGALALGGNSAAFAGSTQVAAGTLAVNGALGGALNVGNGATLAGTGSVGNTVVQSGGAVAPGGNGLGTLNVAGNLTLAQGSSYQLNAASDGRNDQLRVSGAATLQGGSVSVRASGNFQPSTSYSILAASGGVSGQFGGATTDLAFLEPFLTYSPQNVTLRLQRNDVSFQSIAQTPNQRAAAGAVAALGTGPLYTPVVQLGAADARLAFNSLSGEAHASLKSAAVEDSRFVRNASLGRLREAFDTPAATATDTPAASGRGVWAQPFGAWGSTDGDGNASSIDRSTRGIFLGADTRVGGDWRLGVLGGYSHSRMTLDNRPSWVKTDTYHVGVYGGKQWGPLGLRAGATYSAGEADTRRDIAFPGFSAQTAAKYDIKTTQAFGELGWKVPTANGSLEPFAGLAHVKLGTDGFSETGGAAALSGASSSGHTTYSTLGLRGSSSAGMPGGQTRLRGLLGWRHAYGDAAATSTLALAGQPGFAVAGVPIAKNAVVVEGGIDFAVGRNLTMGVSYVGQAASELSDHGVKASLLWKF